MSLMNSKNECTITWAILGILNVYYFVDVFELTKIQTLSQCRMIQFLHPATPHMPAKLIDFAIKGTVVGHLESTTRVVIADCHIF